MKEGTGCVPTVDDAGNVTGFRCTRMGGPPRCACGADYQLLCDYPVEGGTCDHVICRGCAVRVRRGVDYCRRHFAPLKVEPSWLGRAWKALFG